MSLRAGLLEFGLSWGICGGAVCGIYGGVVFSGAGRSVGIPVVVFRILMGRMQGVGTNPLTLICSCRYH